MGLYKVTGPTPVEETLPGDMLEHDYSDTDEADLLASGRLTLEPREWRNIGTNLVCGAKPGDRFTAAFTVGQENALLAGGHIEPVKAAKANKPAKEK